MPSAAALTINDGTANVVFSPDSVTATHVQYQNLAQPSLALRELFHYDRPATSKEVRRSMRVNCPYEITLSDGTKVIKTVTYKVEEISPPDVTSAQRLRARTLAANGLINAASVALFDNPEWVW